MSICVYSSGEMATSKAHGEMKAEGHGDGCDVMGEGSVEVSGWVTGWRVGMHIRGKSWGALLGQGAGQPCLPLHSRGLAQLLAHRHSANIFQMAGGLRALPLRPQSRA